MSMDKVWGIVRAGVAGLGGLLVGLGYADADLVSGVSNAVEQIAGAAAIIAAAVASVYAKVKGE